MMDMKQIQIAVAKADLLITAGIHFFKIALPAAIVVSLFFFALYRADRR